MENDMYLRAVNDEQLGLALRMLYADGLKGYVEVARNEKHKIEYRIGVDVNKTVFQKIRKRYLTIIGV